MGTTKYAKDIPANTNPARAPKDQNAILSSPSGFLAFFTAKARHIAAMTTPAAERVPKTVRSMLSVRGRSFPRGANCPSLQEGKMVYQNFGSTIFPMNRIVPELFSRMITING